MPERVIFYYYHKELQGSVLSLVKEQADKLFNLKDEVTQGSFPKHIKSGLFILNAERLDDEILNWLRFLVEKLDHFEIIVLNSNIKEHEIETIQSIHYINALVSVDEKDLPSLKVAIQNAFRFIDFQSKSLDFTIQTRLKKLETPNVEESYHFLAKHLKDVIWVRNLDLELLYISPSIVDITGFTADESMQMTQSERLEQESLETMYRMLKDELEREADNSIKKHRYRVVEALMKHKNGDHIPVEITVCFLRNENEEAVGILGVTRNITERQRNERDLINSELKFRSLFEKTANAVFYIDTKTGEISDVNISGEKVCGISRTDLIGMPITSFVKNERLEAVNNLGDLKLPFSIEHVKIHSNDGLKLVNFEFLSFSKELLIAIGTDITEQLAVEKMLLDKQDELTAKMEELQAYKEELIASNDAIRETNRLLESQTNEFKMAKEKAEESDRLKTAFLQNMSHEIRTPMNGIIGFAEMLMLEKHNPETLENYLQIISKSSKQLLTIVDDILDISLIESGEIKMYTEQESLNGLVEELFETFKPKALEKELSLEKELPLKDPYDQIIIDKTRFKQVFSNLLNNAIKFTKSGEVSFGYRIEGTKVVFFVRDTGIGIPRHLHAQIFDRFSQVEYNLNRTYGGTGLGLAICKHLVEMMKGEIWVESTENEGSSFYWTLDNVLVNEPMEEELEIKEEEDNDLCKIIVAEDDETNYYFLHEILSEDNIELIHAENGLEAVRYSKLYKDVDLILMDIKMPEMNGLEATRRIREFLPEIPIIAQTAFAMPSDKNEAMNAGCTDYLSKPINRNHLLEKITRYTGKKLNRE